MGLKKPLLIACVIALLLGGSLVYYSSSRKEANQATPSANVAPETTTDSPTATSETSEADTPTNKGSAAISNFSQDAAKVYIRAIVSDVTSGTCQLTLTKEGVTEISKEADIVPSTTYYNCNGFDISKSDIPSPGNWTASIKVKGSSVAATTASLNIVK